MQSLQLSPRVLGFLLHFYLNINEFHLFLQLTDFIEGEYLKEQVEAIKELSDHVTQLKRCGPGLGEFMYDKELSS